MPSFRYLAKDCETTGMDMFHGAKPFLITTCNEQWETVFWEVDVDPFTREPQWSKEDIKEIREYCDRYDRWIYQNGKFDIKAESTIGLEIDDFGRLEDTLLAGHLLASNQPHDLTTMALVYLGVNIKPYEDAKTQACREARALARRKDFIERHGEWAIAEKGRSDMPSAKDKVAGFDMWLPRAIAKAEGYPKDHPWWTVTSEYANSDSAVTLPLFKKQRKIIEKRGLWKIYLERLKVLPVIFKMEQRGVTVSKQKLNELTEEYIEESGRAGRLCVNIAHSMGCELTLPKSGNNSSLVKFAYGYEELVCSLCDYSVDCSKTELDEGDVCPECDAKLNRKIHPGMALEPVKASKKTGVPSFDKAVLEYYESVLPDKSKPLTFIKALKGKRSRDTALSYMEGYKRFWAPLNIFNKTGEQLWYRLHPSLNPTGTDTLRWSSSNPNEQNISKKEGFNLRYCFGPAPGREWWSLDAANIELRIPAYEAGETDMIELFERPNDPPYFGSNHLLICHILHPEKFEQCLKDGVSFKDRYKSTWYQWTKNGDFAVTYGAMEESGTADRAYKVPGAQKRINERFKNIKKLNDYYIEHAEKHGFVYTMPDKSVDPTTGYPLLCTRTSYGKIKPTVPLNYHVQGTACWWMMKAMVRCQEYLDQLNEAAGDALYHMIMQVHDELVFDFPAGRGPEPWKTNLPKVKKIQSLMAVGGDDIGIPTPVSLSYHSIDWSEDLSIP